MRPYLVTPGESPNLGTKDSYTWKMPPFEETRTLHKVIAYTNSPWGLRVTLNDFLLVDIERADIQAVHGGAGDSMQTLWLCGARHEKYIDEDGEEVSRCGAPFIMEPRGRCEVTLWRPFTEGLLAFAVGGEMP